MLSGRMRGNTNKEFQKGLVVFFLVYGKLDVKKWDGGCGNVRMMHPKVRQIRAQIWPRQPGISCCSLARTGEAALRRSTWEGPAPLSDTRRRNALHHSADGRENKLHHPSAVSV